MSLKINTKVDSITWPLNQDLSDQNILAQLDVVVTQDNYKVASKLSINKKAVQFNQPGVYPVIITAVGPDNNYTTKQVQAWVSADNNQANSAPKRQTRAKKKKHPAAIVWGILILILVIILGISSCRAHNDAVQNEQAQSSALNNANNKLDTLGKQNKQLINQNQELQNAIKQYKQNQNKQELQNQLDQIKGENNQLKTNALNNQALQNQINQLGLAIDQIKNNPSQADTIIKQMKNNQNQFLQNLEASFQKLISDLQQLF